MTRRKLGPVESRPARPMTAGFQCPVNGQISADQWGVVSFMVKKTFEPEYVELILIQRCRLCSVGSHRVSLGEMGLRPTETEPRVSNEK